MPLDPAVDTIYSATPIMASVEVGGSGQLEQQAKRGYSGCETGSPHSELDISIRFRNIYMHIIYICDVIDRTLVAGIMIRFTTVKDRNCRGRLYWTVFTIAVSSQEITR